MAQINKPNVIMKPSDLYKQATGQALDAYKTMSSVMDMKKQTELQEKQFEWNKRLKAADAFYNGFIVPGANAHAGGWGGYVREMGDKLAPFFELVGYSPEATKVILNKMSKLSPGQEEIMGYMAANYLANEQKAEAAGATPQQASVNAMKDLVSWDPVAEAAKNVGEAGRRMTGDQGSPGKTPADGKVEVQPGYRMAVENQQGETTVPSEGITGRNVWAYTNIPGQGPASPISVESGGNVSVPEGVDASTFRGDLAYYIAGGTRNNPPDPALAKAWRNKIDALNPKGDETTLQLPEWTAPEAKEKFVSAVKEEAKEPPSPQAKEAVININRYLPVANTEVGKRALKRAMTKASEEFQVRWSNEVVNEEVIKNSASMFSPSDIRDYVLGIPGQTQRLEANADLQREIQANSQDFQREMLSVENMRWATEFAHKVGMDEEQMNLMKEQFEHAKNLDWSKLSIEEQRLELTKLRATYEYMYNTALAQYKARIAAEQAAGLEGGEFDIDLFKALATIAAKKGTRTQPGLASDLTSEAERMLGEMMGLPPESVNSKPFRDWVKRKWSNIWGGESTATPQTSAPTPAQTRTPVESIDLGQIYNQATGGR